MVDLIISFFLAKGMGKGFSVEAVWKIDLVVN